MQANFSDIAMECNPQQYVSYASKQPTEVFVEQIAVYFRNEVLIYFAGREAG